MNFCSGKASRGADQCARDECGKEDIDEIVAARPHVIFCRNANPAAIVEILDRLLSLQEKRER